MVRAGDPAAVAADADAAGGAQSPWVEKRAVVAADANTAGGVGGGDPVAVGEEAGGGGEWEAAAWASANSEVELRRRHMSHQRRDSGTCGIARGGRTNVRPKKCVFVLFSCRR